MKARKPTCNQIVHKRKAPRRYISILDDKNENFFLFWGSVSIICVSIVCFI